MREEFNVLIFFGGIALPSLWRKVCNFVETGRAPSSTGISFT